MMWAKGTQPRGKRAARFAISRVKIREWAKDAPVIAMGWMPSNP
jgi:ribosomal protein S14